MAANLNDPGADAAPTEAVALLLHQHRRLEALLDELTAEAPAALRSLRPRRAGDDLAVHLSAEEQVLYPAVRAERNEDVLLESLDPPPTPPTPHPVPDPMIDPPPPGIGDPVIDPSSTPGIGDPLPPGGVPPIGEPGSV